MARLIPVFIEVVLVVVCLIDAIQTPRPAMRALPKWAWIILILFVPLAGPVAWLVAGRPRRRSHAPVPRTRPTTSSAAAQPPAAPDDDPEFLALLKRDVEHEALLRKWEADLKRREEELRHPDLEDHERPADDGTTGP